MNKKNTNSQTPAQLTYTTYNNDVSTAISRPLREAPTPVLYAIRNEYYEVLTYMNMTDNMTRADDHSKTADTAQKNADKAERAHNSLRKTQAERDEARVNRDTFRAERDSHRAQAQALYSLLDTTAGDRADLLQVSALADLEPATDKERENITERLTLAYLAQFDHATPYEPRTAWKALDAQAIARHIWQRMTEAEQADSITAYIEEHSAELTEQAQRKHRINAVSKYIRAQGSQTAMDSTHTDSTPAEGKALETWFTAGKTFDERYQTKSGTIALEYLTETETRPAGLYFVTRRYTYNSAHSLEKLNEAGDITGYIRTVNTYADSIGALEALESLYNSAELNSRQREYIALFASPEARTAEQEARNEYDRTHADTRTKDRKKHQAGMSKAGYKARLNYAFDHLETPIESDKASARSQFVKRLKEACKRAEEARQEAERQEARRAYEEATPEQQTRARAKAKARQHEELTRKDFLYWEHLTRSNRGTAGEPTARPADQLEAMRQATAEMNPEPVVIWTQTVNPAQLRTITPAELEAEKAQAWADRYKGVTPADLDRLEARRELTRYHEPAPVLEWSGRAGEVKTTTRTPLNAQTIAFQIWERMTPAEQLEAVREEARREQEARARARAEKEAEQAKARAEAEAKAKAWASRADWWTRYFEAKDRADEARAKARAEQEAKEAKARADKLTDRQKRAIARAGSRTPAECFPVEPALIIRQPK